MNFLMTLFLVFCIPFSVKAADEASAIKLVQITIKEGDIVQYPLHAKPTEVEAKINGLSYVCTLMPGDSFEAISILNYRDGIESSVALQKIEGTPGSHEICFKGSSIGVMGTHEVEKSENGEPQTVTKILFPFFIDLVQLQNIQRRKRLSTTLAAEEGETILFKIIGEDIIQYPQDADFIEVESSMNGLRFNCMEAPGDSFEVIGIHNKSHGKNLIVLHKIEGTPGNHEICPEKSSTSIIITDCVLKKTEEGIPEGLLCNHSLKTFFNPPEENDE